MQVKMRYVIVITDLYHRYSVLGFEHGDTEEDDFVILVKEFPQTGQVYTS